VHILREANKLVASLPKAGLSLISDVCFYNNVPLNSSIEDVDVINFQLGINLFFSGAFFA